MDTSRPIELDSYAVDAAQEYLAATEARDEAEARRVKARDELLSFFRLHDADIGLVDGAPFVRLVRTDPERLDVSRLRDEEPLTYRRYAVVSTVYSVRAIRRGRS